MFKKLIVRPIAVTMIVVAVIVLGLVAMTKLPVSLMPDIAIPQVTVKISRDGATAKEINESIIKPIRNQLTQIPSIENMSCESFDGSGIISLRFAQKSKLDLNFIEVNEKIDRTLEYLPRDIERPKVVKACVTDIPVFFLNISQDDTSETKFIELSSFAKEVISKRLEQLPEVALVDMSGALSPQIFIEPDEGKLMALGITDDDLKNAIENSNVKFGSLSIKDGHYIWNIRFESEVKNIDDIANIVLNIKGKLFYVKDLANINERPSINKGLVRSDSKRAITLAVIKQADARMSKLKNDIKEIQREFAHDYPNVNFSISRSQTELLDYSISNLKQNLFIGAILAIIVIFMFLQDFKAPFLVILTIPLSLLLSLLFLYFLHITINIISLSGLILGLGMMVDNSIIVIDNITQHWDRGEPIKNAIDVGVREVIGPMLSSVLTTCAVFIPLIFLSGIAGALFYDEAMAVTAALFSSFFVAVFIIPVYYYLIYKNGNKRPQNRFLSKIQKFDYVVKYEAGLKWCFRHQGIVWSIFISCILLAILLFSVLKKTNLPPVTQNDTVLKIDWNLPISVEENDRRTNKVFAHLSKKIIQSSTLVGKQEFMLSHSGDLTFSQSAIYLKCTSHEDMDSVNKAISDNIYKAYKNATFEFSPAANVFNIIFPDKEAPIVAMLKSKSDNMPDYEILASFIQSLKEKLGSVKIAPILCKKQVVLISDPEKMALYNVDYGSINDALSKISKQYNLFSIKYGSSSELVTMTNPLFSSDLESLTIKNSDGMNLPLNIIAKTVFTRDYKEIYGGRNGDYFPLKLYVKDRDVPNVINTVKHMASKDGEFNVSFSGSYFTKHQMIKELAFILVISVLLLFFILASQFESLIQPFIVMSEIVVDMFGAFLALWISGGGINIMSMIGIVVMSGIVINDSILKVDTINKLIKSGVPLLRAIFTAGSERLKSILMTSLTTIFAIVPFLVKGSLGADLQFPMSVTLIGGMIVGTIVSVFFIPVFYYEIYHRKIK